MRFSFKTSPQETEWDQLRRVWMAADQMEVFDAGWTFDHFVPIHSDPAGPCLEGWTVLSGLAAVTDRLRLGVMVSGNTYRHPAVLTKIACTIDAMSNGRLEFGLGAGWNEFEHESYGIELPPLRERFDRLDEALEIVDSLMTNERTTFTGVHYQLAGAYCEPKPVQQPRIPFVVGGEGEKRTLLAAARWADQWNTPNSDPEVLRHKISVLSEHCSTVGRDINEIEISVQVRLGDSVAKSAESMAALVEAGAGHIIVYLPPPHSIADLESAAEAGRAAGFS